MEPLIRSEAKQEVTYIGFLNLGYTEIAVILLVAILIFGGNLPNVARDLGKKFFDLKRGLNDLNREIYDVDKTTPTTTPARYGEMDSYDDTNPYADDQVHSTPYRPGDVDEESQKVEEEPLLDKDPPRLDIDPDQWSEDVAAEPDDREKKQASSSGNEPASSEPADAGTDDSADVD